MYRRPIGLFWCQTSPFTDVTITDRSRNPLCWLRWIHLDSTFRRKNNSGLLMLFWGNVVFSFQGKQSKTNPGGALLLLLSVDPELVLQSVSGNRARERSLAAVPASTSAARETESSGGCSSQQWKDNHGTFPRYPLCLYPPQQCPYRLKRTKEKVNSNQNGSLSV